MGKYHDVGKLRAKLVQDMKFFLKPEVNSGQLREYDVFVDPRAANDITDISTIEFDVPASSKDFINLGKSEVQMKVRILKNKENSDSFDVHKTTDATTGEETFDYDAATTEIVLPLDSFFQTQWQDVVLTLNDTVVSDSNLDFGYRAYMDMLIRTVDDQMKRLSYKWLYTKDEGQKRKTIVNPYAAKDDGAIQRWRRVKSNNTVQLGGRVWTDFWKHPKLLLMNGVRLNLKLIPYDNKFRFRVTPTGTSFVYQIEEIKMKLRYVTLSQVSLQGVANVLKSHPILYPFVRTQCLKIPLTKGRRDYHFPDLFNRQVPIDLVMGMVDQAADHGSLELDPFYFNRNNVENVAFYVDNVSIPGEPLEFGPQLPFEPGRDEDERARYDEWQLNALESIWEVAGSSRNGFNMKTYQDGNFLIAFKTDPTVPAHVPYWGAIKMGNTALRLRFRDPLPTEQNLILLARFPAVVSISKNRVVKLST